MNRTKKIIVPWDFSEHSEAALQYACRHFNGQAINVLCVLQPPTIYSPGFDWGPAVKEEAAGKCKNEFEKVANLTTNCAVDFQVSFGQPADEVCRFANQIMPDYIVISTHGRTGLKRLVMGSVAQKIFATSKFPVIVLPARWFGEQAISNSNSRDENVVA